MAESSVEERVARIEGILEEMSKRLNHLESDIANLRSEIASLRSEVKSEIANLRGEINSLRGDVSSLFRWTVGLILGMWITILSTLIPILLRILGAI